MEFRNIIVPIDFSEFSGKAVEAAQQIAVHFRSRVTLAHVMITPPDDPHMPESADYQKYLEKYKARISQKMEVQMSSVEGESVPIDYVILHGISPADVLQEYITENNYDLIIIGTHGVSGYRRFVQGSVAEQMVRVASVPVMTVHRSVKNHQIKRILVPIDFSSYSQQALNFADAFARKYDARLVFLHVIEQEIYPSLYEESLESIFEIDPNLQDSVIRNLQDFIEDHIDTKFVEGCKVREGLAHKEIVAFAKENFDLIIIATHGLSGLEYLLLGGTAEKVIRWASCPVLVVK